MAPERAVRKQQNTSRPAAKKAASQATPKPMAHLERIARDFDSAAARCIQHAENDAGADEDAVHRVRTGSRRLEATFEAMLREIPAPASRQMKRLARAVLRPLKQIRQAAGPVRDLDVQRNLLANWIGKQLPQQARGRARAIPAEASALHLQAEKLDVWLKAERKDLAHDMQKQIRKRLQALPQQRQALLAAIAGVTVRRPRVQRPPDIVALENFVRTADAMPLLDAENLHDFRKASKKARYVAESGSDAQTSSSITKALKRIQDAIGEWHDWLCLAQAAREGLGKDGPEVTAALEHEVERRFATAIKITLSMRGRLLGEWMAMRKSPARRPPAAAPASLLRTARTTSSR